MKQSFSLLAMAAGLLLWSCHDRAELSGNARIVDISVEETAPVPLGDLIDTARIFPLGHTGQLIGSVDKLLFAGNKIIVADTRQSKAVFVFDDRNGECTALISRLGRGPEEYASISDVTLTPDKDIAVYDNAGNKVVFYDLDGNFIRKKAVGFWFHRFEYLNDRQIACSLYGTGKRNPKLMHSDYANCLIVITDADFKPEAGLMPNRFENESYGWITPHLAKFDDTVYVNPSFGDTIYRVAGRSLEPCYRLDMAPSGGVANFPADMTNEKLDEAFDRNFLFPGQFVIGKEFMLLNFADKTAGVYKLYDRCNGRLYSWTLDPQVNAKARYGLLYSDLSQCQAVCGDEFVAAVPAYRVAPALDEEARTKYPELQDLTEDSNPLLVFYRLKHPGPGE